MFNHVQSKPATIAEESTSMVLILDIMTYRYRLVKWLKVDTHHGVSLGHLRYARKSSTPYIHPSHPSMGSPSRSSQTHFNGFATSSRHATVNITWVCFQGLASSMGPWNPGNNLHRDFLTIQRLYMTIIQIYPSQFNPFWSNISM